MIIKNGKNAGNNDEEWYKTKVGQPTGHWR